MPTRKIDIELRLQKKGSVLSWEVLLENTNSSSRVDSGWVFNPDKNYYYVVLEKYPINDNALDVFVGCEGKLGGKIICAVLINGEAQNEAVECKTTDPNYGHGVYSI